MVVSYSLCFCVLQNEIAKNWLQAFDQVRRGVCDDAIVSGDCAICKTIQRKWRLNPLVKKWHALQFSYSFFLLYPPLVQLIALSQPSVIALHCQEMGGKNFRQSMKAAADFGQ